MASAQIVIPSKLGTSQQGGGDGKGQGYYVVTGKGENVTAAASNMQTKISRESFAGHRQVIVVGEQLAKQGLKPILDEYSRNPDVRLRTDIFVVKGGTAKELSATSYLTG